MIESLSEYAEEKKEAWRYLLSHGETPHYHWRESVSLLRSKRDQVVPARYGRQAKGKVRGGYICVSACSSLVLQLSLFHSAITNAFRDTPNTWGYMVKPHGQLVQVSFTRYRASTPCLSTSWSLTGL